MNSKHQNQIMIAILAAVVVYLLFSMFTKKSGFNPARYRSGAQYAANQALEQKKNEIRRLMSQRNHGGAQGDAAAARLRDIQMLVKQGDRDWKQALTEVYEMKG
jgi:hypothetical protein